MVNEWNSIPEVQQPGDAGIRGLEMTARMMENYRLLKAFAEKEQDSFNPASGITGGVLNGMYRSRENTQYVVSRIEEALTEVQADANGTGDRYKVEAFERRYLQGQTYEQISEAMNAGRNSPARWCKEVMRRMAVRLFGVDGIGL